MYILPAGFLGHVGLVAGYYVNPSATGVYNVMYSKVTTHITEVVVSFQAI